MAYTARRVITFPESFAFGTATSATQVEGGCPNTDWYMFGRAGRIKNGDTPDIACDQWNRWAGDMTLETELGMNAARMSIEWARIEPRPGVIDESALDHYRAILGAHADAGIRTMVTLHHFSLPLWLTEKKGLLAQDLAHRMTSYARTVVRALGDLASEWLTINEPNVLAAHAHLLGAWPPAEKSVTSAWTAHRNLLAAHHAMYRAIHEERPDAKVGLAHHLRLMLPARAASFIDRLGAGVLRRVFNDWFASAVCKEKTQDFFGLNYYSRDRVRFDLTRGDEMFLHRAVSPGSDVTDLGWEIYPEGLFTVIREWWHRSGRIPIYVTENGIADAEDSRRASFLVRHLARVARAIAEGIDVRGYYHWSLLDNFEWAEGYGPRFGLVAVDYATQARTIRASGHVYARIAKARAIDDAMWRLHGDPAEAIAG
jgi:beta-glucosidase